MMGKKEGQLQMIIMDIRSLIPENHLLQKIDHQIDFEFIYEKASPYFPK